MPTPRPHPALRLAALLLVCAAPVGCGSVTLPWDRPPAGRPTVGQETLNRIKPGETTDGWLLAVLGRPLDREGLRSGSGAELWRYEFDQVYSRLEPDRPRPRRISGQESEAHRPHVVYVQLAQGVVTDWWRE